MPDAARQNTARNASKAAAPGLRDRKKAKRRHEILRCAEKLFAVQGIEATTVAAIAEEAGVSAPTVFNYFGSKDNLLSCLIFEGAETSRKRWDAITYDPEDNLLETLTTFLSEVSEKTIRIAGKRVWRYAEAANIRRPNTDFEQRFASLDSKLVEELARLFAAFPLVMRNGAVPDPVFLANLFFDRWTAHYMEFIKNDKMTLATHRKRLERDVAQMVSLLFDDRLAEPAAARTARG